MALGDIPSRALIAASGILGAAGVAAAAGAEHVGNERLLGSMALVALSHAPALLALGLFGRKGPVRWAGVVLAAGAIGFCADLATRHFTAHALLPMLAPASGMVMIVGWAGMALAAALFPPRDIV
ncbi:MAG: DUF423 domain-containing protein [Bauldia sp.]